ncbi:MAG: dephospho-CoA kinase [Phascolarctobacterium sp.]|nr:dephospho-CoA kinase [Phascolarctobacterium sp.]
MIIIGLTGGIASGKSTVSNELRKLNIPIFDADEVSRNAVTKGSLGLQLVIEAFGQDYLTQDGEMDRAKVSQLVFANKEARQTLEHIIHKIVWGEAETFLAKCREANANVAVLDVPLLIECGWHKNVDKVWLVAVDKRQQIERAMKRSGMTEAEVTARIDAQMSLDEKKKHADVIIDNSGSLNDTLIEVHNELAKLAR